MMTVAPCILIIDDEESLRKSLSHILKRKGYEVESAGTGKEALTKAKSRLIDLALLDIKLPDSDGIDLIARLKDLNPVVSIIMISGYASVENTVSSLNAGAAAFFVKPINNDELLTKLQDLLERQELIREKRQAGEALQESEERFKNIFVHATEGILIADISTRKFLHANPSICMILGYSAEELASMELKDIHREKDFAHVQEEFIALARGEKKLAESIPVLRKDGVVRYVDIGASRIMIDGHPCNLGIFTDITERKRVEEALRTSEEQFRGITERISDLIIIVDPEGYMTFVSPSITSILGFSPDSYIGKRAGPDIIHPEDVVKIGQAMEKAKNGSPGEQVEFRMPKSDGSYAVFEGRGNPVFTQGIFVGVQVVARDITERKRAEESLRESEEKYRALVNFGLDPVVIFDGTGKTLFLNKASASLLGTDDVMALHGKNVLEFIAPESQADVIKDFEQVMQGNDAYLALYKVRTINGNEIWVESVGKRISYEGKPADLVSLHDITARKKAEDELRESEERFRTIIHSMQFGIVIIDAQTHTILDANEKAREMIGGSTDVIVGSVCHRFICPVESGRCPVTDLKQTVDSSERVLLTLRGEKIPILKSVITTTLGGKKVLIESFIDITDRKRAETALHIAQEKYTKAFLLAPDAITVSDLESGRFVEINEAASGIFGYPRDELIGKSSLELGIWQNKEARDAFIDQIRTQGSVVQFEVVERRKSGELFHASVTADTISIGTTRYLIATTRDITERKRVEQALKESEARYSSLFTNSYSVFLLIDPDTGMIVDANDAACQYYGYSKEQLTAMGIFDLNRLPKEKVVRDLVHAKDAGAKHFFSTHLLANGERRNVEVFSGPIAVQGKPLFYSIIHDITDRVRAEQALLDSEAQMNAILHGSPIPKFVIDTLHRIISWNKALEEVSGMKAQDMLGTSLHWKAFYEKERPCMADLLLDKAIDKIPQLYKGKYRKSEITEGGYEATDFFPHMGKNGKWLRFVAAPIRDANGTMIGAVETLEDITGLKEAELSLKESEGRYRTLVDQLPDYVIVHRNGVLLYVNPAAAQQLGYDNQALIGKPITLFIAPEHHDKVRQAIMQRTAGEEVTPYEMTITAHDGTSHAVLVNGAQVQYEGAPASLNVLTDITVIKEAEEAIRRANEDLELRVAERTESLIRTNLQLEEEIRARNAAEQKIHRSLEEKDLLLREIHHRVKNNLQIIASMLNLQSRTIQDEKVLGAIKDSQSRVRAMALVHERIYRSHNIGEIDLPEYLQYLVKQLFMFHNIPHTKVAITFSMEPITTDIDTIVPIGLIINELVSNSLKHAFPGERKGRITIEGKSPSPDLLEFTYRDDGVGIPQDVDWRNPTSLGLRLITSLVEQLSGEITMERDGGTVFAFTLRQKKPVKPQAGEEKHE